MEIQYWIYIFYAADNNFYDKYNYFCYSDSIQTSIKLMHIAWKNFSKKWAVKIVKYYFLSFDAISIPTYMFMTFTTLERWFI